MTLTSNIPPLSGCDRNGMAGNCSSENCDTLMEGECPIQDELDQDLLYELGIIEEKSAGTVSDTADAAYDRAMEIL